MTTTIQTGTRYTVTQYWTSAQQQIADEITSLRQAKRIAAKAWRKNPSWYIEISDGRGSTITAAQAIGRGLLWTH